MILLNSDLLIWIAALNRINSDNKLQNCNSGTGLGKKQTTIYFCSQAAIFIWRSVSIVQKSIRCVLLVLEQTLMIVSNVSIIRVGVSVAES